MITFELRRDLSTPQESVGVLTVNGRTFQTIERPWIPNSHGGKGGEKFVSCVPPGLYRLERYNRPSGEKAFILSAPALDVFQYPADVPVGREKQCRTLCLIHAANWAYEVNGCIGPGMDRSKQPAGWFVSRSREAMNSLRTLINSELELKLRIEDISGGSKDNGDT